MCSGPDDTKQNILKCLRKNFDHVHMTNMLTDWEMVKPCDRRDKMVSCLQQVLQEEAS